MGNFPRVHFVEQIENVLSLFPYSYGNTCESLGDFEIVVEILAYGSCFQSFSSSPKRPLVL